MLSYEERKAIENLKIEYEKLMKEDNILFPLYKSNAKRLIDIIEKQSKEIEELKEQCKEVVCVPEGTCFMFEPKDVDKKWEDKIKAKIEEYDDKGMTINLTNRSAGKTFQQAVHYEVKKILQSLLEKEGE